MNTLYYGDNFDIMRHYIDDESVDLVYLDPPFKSNQDYNVLFAEQDGSRSASQILAFEDTWQWDVVAAKAYQETVEKGGKVSEALQAFRKLVGDTDMLAYVSMMAPRLMELRRVLKRTGSVYLHCDSNASAHLRLLMDAVFGVRNFRNEIIWYYYNKIHDRRKRLFPRATDTLLFYVKDLDSDFTYHQLKEIRPEPIKQLARKKVDGRMVNVKDKDGHVVYRMKADRTLDNVWRIPCLQPAASEKLGYPTQKPTALLDRVIAASSNEGDVVLDPFCGCGTAIESAEKLDREWIGIDITHLAIALIKHRLKTAFRGRVSYNVIGEPVSLPDAEALAQENRFQFQCWALGLVGARPTDPKRGADQGIDGRLLFHDDKRGVTKQIVISVKSGAIPANHIRELRGVIDREKASIGLLITLDKPTRPMKAEAASAGFYNSPFGNTKHPRLQILTVEELLQNKEIDYPRTDANVTLKRARPIRPIPPKSGKLPFS